MTRIIKGMDTFFEQFQGGTEYYRKLAQNYRTEPIQEITEEVYWHFFECLPPQGYARRDGVERFWMMEMSTGDITNSFAQMDGRYYYKPIHLHERDTWFTREMIEAYNAEHV